MAYRFKSKPKHIPTPRHKRDCVKVWREEQNLNVKANKPSKMFSGEPLETAESIAKDRAKGDKKQKKIGRPEVYDPEVARQILDYLVRGLSIRAACEANPDFPSSSSVYKWILRDDIPFKRQYAEAKQLQAYVNADEILEIADDGRNDWMAVYDRDGNEGWKFNGEHYQRSKLRIDTRKWIASKLLPKVYGASVLNDDNKGHDDFVLDEGDEE